MADDPKPEPEVQPKPELAERVGAIEAEQQRQGTVLQEIKGMLAGAPKDPAGGTGGSENSPPGQSVAEQVRRGVEEIEARKKREADEAAARDADSAWRANVDQRLAERRPAEPATGRKARLQARMFGKPDPR